MPIDSDVAADLFRALVQVQKLLVAARHTAPQMRPGVDPAAYPVLFVLGHAGPHRISGLADRLHNDVSTVSRTVSAFAELGLVVKQTDPDDGRAQLVSLTDSGREAMHAIEAARTWWFQHVFSDWDPAEAQAFLGHLRRLADHLDASLRERGAAPAADTAPLDVTKDPR